MHDTGGHAVSPGGLAGGTTSMLPTMQQHQPATERAQHQKEGSTLLQQSAVSTK